MEIEDIRSVNDTIRVCSIVPVTVKLRPSKPLNIIDLEGYVESVKIILLMIIVVKWLSDSRDRIV